MRRLFPCQVHPAQQARSNIRVDLVYSFTRYFGISLTGTDAALPPGQIVGAAFQIKRIDDELVTSSTTDLTIIVGAPFRSWLTNSPSSWAGSRSDGYTVFQEASSSGERLNLWRTNCKGWTGRLVAIGGKLDVAWTVQGVCNYSVQALTLSDKQEACALAVDAGGVHIPLATTTQYRVSFVHIINYPLNTR